MWKTRTPIKTMKRLLLLSFRSLLFVGLVFLLLLLLFFIIVLGCGWWGSLEKRERYYPTLFSRSDYFNKLISIISLQLFCSLSLLFLGVITKTWKKPRKLGKKSSRHVKRVALIKLYPFHNNIINTYTHKVVVLCFEWYASLIKVRLRFIVLFFFFFFVVRGRRRRRRVERNWFYLSKSLIAHASS